MYIGPQEYFDDRSWMYNRVCKGRLVDGFIDGCDVFLDFVYGKHPELMDGKKIMCPCAKCLCLHWKARNDVKACLIKNGFKPGYTRWSAHGEPYEPRRCLEEFDDHENDEEWGNWRDMHMINDAFGMCEQEEPTEDGDVRGFYKLLGDSEVPLYEGCKPEHTKFSIVTRLLQLKSDNLWSQKSFDDLLTFLHDILPGEKVSLPKNYSATMTMMKKMGLGYEKIDACKNDCVLFWKDTAQLESCPTCGESRYKNSGDKGLSKKLIPHKVLRHFPLIPRLQRLYMSRKTAEHMRWHKEGRMAVEGEMRHPADAKEWKNFDNLFPDFGNEARNVRLGLATDGFEPFDNTPKGSYSIWPVFVFPYNLPPWMCMKQANIFMSLLIPGPNSPTNDIDVYLQPLIKELKELWGEGVCTFDASVNKTFKMKAALMWTVHDFPAYGYVSGWSTHGKLACPICMSPHIAEDLGNSRKPCWFGCARMYLDDKHKYRERKSKDKFDGKEVKPFRPKRLSGEVILQRLETWGQVQFGKGKGINKRKRSEDEFPGFGKEHNFKKMSIFFELPYWKFLELRHCLDAMHAEKNTFDATWWTVMNMNDKTKDTVKGRLDMERMNIRRQLHIQKRADGKDIMPKGDFTLSKELAKKVFEWVSMLKLPDGYCSNIARCVSDKHDKMSGLKSHDSRVLMERFMPLAFRGLLPDHIWEPIFQLSSFYRTVTSKVCKDDEMKELEKKIVEVLCQLEMIFPPGYFDSMQHILMHLPEEVRIGGPVQYRWMYPFERYINRIKKKIGNKARPEGSIANAYIVDELVTFCSRYFHPDIETRLNRPSRNDDYGPVEDNQKISVFKGTGMPLGASNRRYMPDMEYLAAEKYVLHNCEEAMPFMDEYRNFLRAGAPYMSGEDLEEMVQSGFVGWFRERIRSIDDRRLLPLAEGPTNHIECWKVYKVNGFRFQAMDIAGVRTTQNNGVYVSGSYYDGAYDYYGYLEEVIRLKYRGAGNYVDLFRCTWYDPTNKGCSKDRYNIITVDITSRLRTYEPFVLACQAKQVFYTPVLTRKGPHKKLQYPIPVVPRNTYEMSMSPEENDEDDIYQEE